MTYQINLAGHWLRVHEESRGRAIRAAVTEVYGPGAVEAGPPVFGREGLIHVTRPDGTRILNVHYTLESWS